MNKKRANLRSALPYPPQARREQSLVSNDLPTKQSLIKQLVREKEQLEFQRELIEARLDAIKSGIGTSDSTQSSKLKIQNNRTQQVLQQWYGSVGMLKWIYNLAEIFRDPGESCGNVAGVRWATAVLIADDLILTAGHCVDQAGGGWQRPSRRERVLQPNELATLLTVSFDLQTENDASTISQVIFPVVELVQYREKQLDYAIMRIDKNISNTPSAQLKIKTRPLALSLDKSGQFRRSELTRFYLLGFNDTQSKISAEEISIQSANGSYLHYSSFAIDQFYSGTPIVSDKGTVVGIKLAQGYALQGAAIPVNETANLA